MALPTLADARAALAAALGAQAHVPEVIDPPCNVIEPGAPYLTYGGTRGAVVARMDVYVLVPSDDNAAMLTQLDAALFAALDAIDATDDWIVQDIEKPGLYFTADWTAYGVRVTAAAHVNRP